MAFLIHTYYSLNWHSNLRPYGLTIGGTRYGCPQLFPTISKAWLIVDYNNDLISSLGHHVKYALFGDVLTKMPHPKWLSLQRMSDSRLQCPTVDRLVESTVFFEHATMRCHYHYHVYADWGRRLVAYSRGHARLDCKICRSCYKFIGGYTVGGGNLHDSWLHDVHATYLNDGFGAAKMWCT